MFKFISSIFNPITAETIARKQLNDARMELLTSEANREYFSTHCTMLKERINRLESGPYSDKSAPSVVRRGRFAVDIPEPPRKTGQDRVEEA